MRITRDHLPWGGAVAAVALAAGVAYAVAAAGAARDHSGGSWLGLTFGIAGSACMLLAAFLSARKKVLLWRIGSAQLWMKIHLWLGALAVPLILLHAGFRLGGPLTTALMALFVVVIASGVLGLVAQHVVPSWMTASVPLETVYGQIEQVTAGLRLAAYEVVAALAGPIPEAAEEAAAAGPQRQAAAEQVSPEAEVLRDLYLRLARPYLLAAPSRAPTPDLFGARADVPDELTLPLQKLADLCEECRQLRVQRRLHHVLHAWLFVHAPLSLALLVLAAVHALYALYY